MTLDICFDFQMLVVFFCFFKTGSFINQTLKLLFLISVCRVFLQCDTESEQEDKVGLLFSSHITELQTSG